MGRWNNLQPFFLRPSFFGHEVPLTNHSHLTPPPSPRPAFFFSLQSNVYPCVFPQHPTKYLPPPSRCAQFLPTLLFRDRPRFLGTFCAAPPPCKSSQLWKPCLFRVWAFLTHSNNHRFPRRRVNAFLSPPECRVENAITGNLFVVASPLYFFLQVGCRAFLPPPPPFTTRSMPKLPSPKCLLLLRSSVHTLFPV